MKNGLYKVNFRTPLGSGDGIVVLDNGKIQGGDSAMFYRGALSEDRGQFSAEVAVGRHTRGLPSVFGIDNLSLSLRGSNTEEAATMTGTSPAAPGVTLHATLTLIQ